MDYRHTTPPSAIEVDDYDTLQCPGGSASTNGSYYPLDWSPATVNTATTTPPRTPLKITIRETTPGPLLLPRVRSQDQLMEPSACYPYSRAVSLPSNGYPLMFGAALPAHPGYDRRSASPFGDGYLLTPSSAQAPSPANDAQFEMMMSNRPSISNARSSSATHIRTHSRNASSSSSSIDASVLSRYSYPTYRQSPTPQFAGGPTHMSQVPNAMSHLAPISMPGGHIQSYPKSRRTASPPANPSRLSMGPELADDEDIVFTTVLEYLTGPNPAPSLTQRPIESGKGQSTHFWFDIRNLRPWTDFNVSNISAIPGLLRLLKIDVDAKNLPAPGRVTLNPETPSQLAEICANHHAVKVNAALIVAQGRKHIQMRALKASSGARQQPEFVASYQSDAEKTIYGDGRGRVVGIVKCYEQWNSGMRSGSPNDRVKYLRHLAHLHHFMREHGTRYGFIMTEIELVCVRAGGPPNGENIPLFGYLEVAAPVQVDTSGTALDGSLKMTVGLALWYLHMLAKEQPLDAQFHWKLQVGGPAALTRRHHQARDDWMPKPNMSEKRDAKRVRGWVWPDEPLSKRECGRGRKSRATK